MVERVLWVTTRDIREARLYGGCPLRGALQRQVRSTWVPYIYVGAIPAAGWVTWGLQVRGLPMEVIDFVKCFRAGLSVKPLKFRLMVPTA